MRVTIGTAGTLGSISALTGGVSGLDFAAPEFSAPWAGRQPWGGDTCSVSMSYKLGDTCTVRVTFTPRSPGVRYGAVVLAGGSGNVLGTTYLKGVGVGAQTSFPQGTVSTVWHKTGTGPYGVAVDGAGDLFVADTNNFRLLKETLVSGGYVESTISTSPLIFPCGIAVDGAGNVYVVDSGRNQVLKETPSGGVNYTESVVSTSGLNTPYAVAVDGSGNVYIADYRNNRVLKETPSSGGYVESEVTTTRTMTGAEAVAVDASENVYIVDDNGDLLKERPWQGGYFETVLATGLYYPGWVSVDSEGDIYVSDTGDNLILKETPKGGDFAQGGAGDCWFDGWGEFGGDRHESYTESTVPVAGLNYALEVVPDGNGNLYIANDSNDSVLKLDVFDAPSLSFASTVEGSTSADSPRTVVVGNYGNARLRFSAVAFPTDFPEASGTTGDCSRSTKLESAETCKLTIDFTPVAALNGAASAQLTEGVSITSNTLNVEGTQQTVAVTGQEIQE